MISGALPRGLAVLERMVGCSAGLTLGAIAEGLDVPKPGVYRALSELVESGYVLQEEETGLYRLGVKFPALALRHLAAFDLAAAARPILQSVADRSREHVRLALVEGGRLTFVAHAQGATSALRFNPEGGAEPSLYYTATGVAWLSSMSDERALELAYAQGVGDASAHGPNAPKTVQEFLGRLEHARNDGYAMVDQSNELGVSGVAVAVWHESDVVAVLTIVGPSFRLTEERMLSLVPVLKEAAEELGLYGGQLEAGS